MAIRDMEAPIRGSPEFNQFCWADVDSPVPESPRTAKNPTFEDVKCSLASFVSPLDMLYFFDLTPNDLENVTQDQLDNALQSAVEDPAIWSNFKALFDKEVNKDNITVRYIRSLFIFAGPLQYKNGLFLENGEPVYDRYNELSDRYDE